VIHRKRFSRVFVNKTDSATDLENGSYLVAFLYRVPKKNYDAITHNLKKFIPWFENKGVRNEYYQLASRDRFVIAKCRVKEIFVDETLLKINGQDYWLWIAYEPNIHACLLFHLSRERTICVLSVFQAN
jgi:hypothetical protein